MVRVLQIQYSTRSTRLKNPNETGMRPCALVYVAQFLSYYMDLVVVVVVVEFL